MAPASAAPLYVPTVPETVPEMYGYDVTDFDADIDTVRRNLDAFWQDARATYRFDTPSRTFEAPGVAWTNGLGGTATDCGNFEPKDVSPAFYCPASKVIYLDHRYLRYVSREYGLDGVGHVLAHEYGHHVQWQLGSPWRMHGKQKLNELSADCLAGVSMEWMSKRWTKLDRSELGRRSHSIGDSGVDTADGPSHGTGAQRLWAFLTGWDLSATEWEQIAACQPAQLQAEIPGLATA